MIIFSAILRIGNVLMPIRIMSQFFILMLIRIKIRLYILMPIWIRIQSVNLKGREKGKREKEGKGKGEEREGKGEGKQKGNGKGWRKEGERREKGGEERGCNNDFFIHYAVDQSLIAQFFYILFLWLGLRSAEELLRDFQPLRKLHGSPWGRILQHYQLCASCSEGKKFAADVVVINAKFLQFIVGTGTN